MQEWDIDSDLYSRTVFSGSNTIKPQCPHLITMTELNSFSMAILDCSGSGINSLRQWI
jgi:hypothetical protein